MTMGEETGLGKVRGEPPKRTERRRTTKRGRNHTKIQNKLKGKGECQEKTRRIRENRRKAGTEKRGE